MSINQASRLYFRTWLLLGAVGTVGLSTLLSTMTWAGALVAVVGIVCWGLGALVLVLVRLASLNSVSLPTPNNSQEWREINQHWTILQKSWEDLEHETKALSELQQDFSETWAQRLRERLEPSNN